MQKLKFALFFLHSTLAASLLFGAMELDPAVEETVESILSEMTLIEKLDMLSGRRIDEIKGVSRIGLPAMRPTDGPIGVRIYGNGTAFPSGISLASSWNTELVGEVAQAISREFKAYGKNVLLGPCVNIVRSPHGGRNFESFGEDPFLTSRLAVSYIESAQAEGVIASVKHFACNNQEIGRRTIDVQVEERALREIYLPAFRASVQEAGAWSVMGSYNRLNGHYACANDWLLIQVLRDDWGFKGFVISDWNATHSMAKSLNAGLDLEMPLGKHFGLRDLYEGLRAGEITEERVEEAVRRMLRAMVASGIYDQPEPVGGILDTPEHRRLARESAVQGMVLLKNEGGVLPLEKENLQRVALIGAGAKRPRVSGGGSSKVQPFYKVSPFEGIVAALGGAAEVVYAEGFRHESDFVPIEARYLSPPDGLWESEGLYGEYHDMGTFDSVPILRRIDPIIDFGWQFPSPASGREREAAAIRWEGFLTPEESGEYEIAGQTVKAVRVFIDGEPILEKSEDGEVKRRRAVGRVTLEAGRRYPIRVEYEGSGSEFSLGWRRSDLDTVADAVEAAKSSDVAIVFAGWLGELEGEESDRELLALPEDQVRVIREVSKVNPNTIVVLHGGAQVVMDEWLDEVRGVLMAWYFGQEGGNAIADIVFGEANPSGKLPLTFVRRWEDHSAFGNYPGDGDSVRYEEGVYVGYRHAEKKGIEPLFPFGFGLSYTNFAFETIKLSRASMGATGELWVRCKVKNTGDVAGAEVAQLYLEDLQASLDRPVKELKGFQRVALEPGESKTVAFRIKYEDLCFYSEAEGQWKAEPGRFRVHVGNSSRDIELKAEFELK